MLRQIADQNARLWRPPAARIPPLAHNTRSFPFVSCGQAAACGIVSSRGVLPTHASLGYLPPTWRWSEVTATNSPTYWHEECVHLHSFLLPQCPERATHRSVN